jgi:hypothetical protein
MRISNLQPPTAHEFILLLSATFFDDALSHFCDIFFSCCYIHSPKVADVYPKTFQEQQSLWWHSFHKRVLSIQRITVRNLFEFLEKIGAYDACWSSKMRLILFEHFPPSLPKLPQSYLFGGLGHTTGPISGHLLERFPSVPQNFIRFYLSSVFQGEIFLGNPQFDVRSMSWLQSEDTVLWTINHIHFALCWAIQGWYIICKAMIVTRTSSCGYRARTRKHLHIFLLQPRFLRCSTIPAGSTNQRKRHRRRAQYSDFRFLLLHTSDLHTPLIQYPHPHFDSSAHTRTTSTRSNGFCVIWVCISSSSSSV